MKAFLVTVSPLCFCTILLCFLAYSTDRLPGAPIVATLQMPVASDPQCSPCEERMASLLEMMEREWERELTSFLEQPAPPLDQRASGWARLSQEQREQAKRFFDQYDTEAGARRFRKVDPAGARQFDQERRELPVRSESGEEPSTR